MSETRTSIERARDLITIVGGLARSGDSLDPGTVAARLGIPEDEVEQLMDLLVSAGSDGGDAAKLPLALDESGGLSYVAELGHSTRGRTLRLTRGEADALTAALDEIGIGSEDPLRRAIERALYPTGVDLTAVRTASSDPDLSDRINALSQAVVAKVALEFAYEPAAAPPTEAPLPRRHAMPLALRHERGHWYLDAYDLDRNDQRSFRVDRMGNPVTTEAAESMPDSGTSHARPRMTSLLFSDLSLFEIHEWPGIVITGSGHGNITCEIPWYPGSDWLPRHLAACGGSVRIYDPELKQAVADYARSLLPPVETPLAETPPRPPRPPLVEASPPSFPSR